MSRPGSRRVEIDIAKGLACLLMIAAHSISVKLLPFGTFAAPLFFACSGMNTILLLAKTRSDRRYDLFHLLFPLLLFFGGSTQIVIMHGGVLRVAPEFLQCIALSLLALFLLSRAFRNPLHVGFLFPVPFLAQQLLRLIPPLALRGTPWEYLFGTGFALLPWLGFFLFGAFLLDRGRQLSFRLPGMLAVAFAASHVLAGMKLEKFWMSLPYVFLALLAVSLAYLASHWLVHRAGRAPGKVLAGALALPGRNALMFLYLHYLALHSFASGDFLHSLWPAILFETLYLFLICWVMLLVYERVRHEAALLPPVLGLLLVLGTLRWAGLLSSRVDLRLVDIVVGVLFAFVYVLLRRRYAAFLARGQAAVN